MPQQSTLDKVQSRVAAFRNRNRIPLTLPSGIEILAKKVSLFDLFTAGKLPDSLSGVISEMIRSASQRSGKAPQVDSGALEQRMMADLLKDPSQMFALYDEVLIAAGIEPRFVRTVTNEETEVNVADVDMADKQFVWNWCQGGEVAQAAAAFRAESGGAVPAGSEGQAVRSAPSDAAGA